MEIVLRMYILYGTIPVESIMDTVSIKILNSVSQVLLLPILTITHFSLVSSTSKEMIDTMELVLLDYGP